MPRVVRRFDAVYQGIRRADKDKLVRVQNPVLLLEHGQQIGNAPLGNLMYVMGLDVLFMAGESANFVPRVAGFLGLDTLLFPVKQVLTGLSGAFYSLGQFRYYGTLF